MYIEMCPECSMTRNSSTMVNITFPIIIYRYLDLFNMPTVVQAAATQSTCVFTWPTRPAFLSYQATPAHLVCLLHLTPYRILETSGCVTTPAAMCGGPEHLSVKDWGDMFWFSNTTTRYRQIYLARCSFVKS